VRRKGTKTFKQAIQSYKTNYQKAITGNDQLEVTPAEVIILSDEEGHKNVVNIPTLRRTWSEEDIAKNMDHKVWQLITPEGYVAPEEEIIAATVEEVKLPPFGKPEMLTIAANNVRYVVAEGQTYEHYGASSRAFMPSATSDKGGMSTAVKPTWLFYHDSHALYHVREVINYEDEDGDPIREGLEYEWTLDGDLVSTKPYFQMYNAKSDGEVQWTKSKDRTITCKVTNEHGSISQDLTFRVYGIQDGSNGNHTYRFRKGYWREFDQDKFNTRSLQPYSNVTDPETANRTIVVNKVHIKRGGLSPSLDYILGEKGHQYRNTRARYRVNGGPWVSHTQHFTNINPSSKRYVKNFLDMRSGGSNKPITWEQKGGTTATVDFEVRWQVYDFNFWGTQRHWTSKWTGKIDIGVPLSTDTGTIKKAITSGKYVEWRT
jgi:hypothetical protein